MNNTTKLVILAAGEGTRLRPLTENIPKCMVPLKGKPLVLHQIETANAAGLTDIHVVGGYRHDAINFEGITKHINKAFASTNMVASLFCAESALNGDVIVGYGDIVYQPDVLQSLMKSTAPVAVVVDEKWRAYWSARMNNPLDDAETLKLGDDGKILELGKKASSYNEIEGQYIGLIKFSKDSWSQITPFYHSLDRTLLYEGRNIDEMYMTTFLQLIAENLMPIQAVMIQNGWMEVDKPSDLNFTRFLNRESKPPSRH